jgi:hypothetical protein
MIFVKMILSYQLPVVTVTELEEDSFDFGDLALKLEGPTFPL